MVKMIQLALLFLLINCQTPLATQKAQFIGIPGMTRPLVLDCTLGEDSNAQPTLYLCTYARGNNSGCTFLGIDPASGEVKLSHFIPGRIGPYHLATDSSGKIYATIYGSGEAELLCYDPKTDSIEILNPNLDSEDFSFGLSANLTGGVIFGTHGEGKIITYDPDSREFQDLGTLIEGNKYPKAFLALSPDSILIGSGAPAHLSLLDPITGIKRTNLLPKKYQEASFVYNLWMTGEYIWCRLAPSGKVLLISRADMTVLKEFDTLAFSAPIQLEQGFVLLKGHSGIFYKFNPNTMDIIDSLDGLEDIESVSLFKLELEKNEFFTGITSEGLWWRWDPISNELITTSLPFPKNSTRVTALSQGPDGSLYAGTYETNGLYRYQAEHEEWSSLGNIAPGHTGEILAMAANDKELFTLSYIEAVLCRYDPQQAWKPGTISGANPLEIGRLGHEQNRPFDMCFMPDRKLYMVTFAGYGKTSGALSVYDPVTHHIDVYRGLNGQGNLYALAPGPDSLLFLGTSQTLEGLEVLPGNAAVLIYDTREKALLPWRVEIPQCKTVDALYYGSADSSEQKSLYAVGAGSCYRIAWPDTSLYRFPLPPIVGVIGNASGVYAAGPQGVFKLETEGRHTRMSAVGPDFSGAFSSSAADPTFLNFARKDSVFSLAIP